MWHWSKRLALVTGVSSKFTDYNCSPLCGTRLEETSAFPGYRQVVKVVTLLLKSLFHTFKSKGLHSINEERMVTGKPEVV